MLSSFTLSIQSWFAEFGKAFVDKLIEEVGVGDIGEEINHGILQWKNYFYVGSVELLITDAIIVSWIAIAAIIIFAIWGVSKRSLIPSKKQTVMELIVGLIISSCEGFGMNKKEAEYVAPMVGTFGLVIMACNVCSVFKISPPAKNIAFPVALGFFSIVYVIVASVKMVGVKGFMKSLVYPMPAMLPFKVLDFIIKPISLSLRLFGNVFGAYVFMEFIYIVVPIVLPGVFGLWFDLIDGILQAVVFAYLTMSYIGEIVEIAHSSEEKPKKVKAKNKKNAEPAIAEQTAA